MPAQSSVQSREEKANAIVKGVKKQYKGLPTFLPAVLKKESVALKLLHEYRKAYPDRKLNFKELWKMWLMDERTMLIIEYAACTNRRFLTKLLDKCFPTPQTILDGSDQRPISISIGVMGQNVNLNYAPQGRVEGVLDPMQHKEGFGKV